MKKLTAIITAIAVVLAGINFTPKQIEAAVQSSQGSSSWGLVWSDEFDQATGGSVNGTNWQFDIGDGGWGNNEVQYYTNSTDNVKIVELNGALDGKALAITAKRSDGRITSGRIKSLDKQYVRYGRIEARIKMNNGMQPGVWPAFWMMGNDIDKGNPWPTCGEIDIMEHRNAETSMISTIHWNPNANGASGHQYYGSELNGQFGYMGSMDDWHTYAVEWYEDCMKFFLDGNCFETITLTDAMAEEFHKPHFILLNVAIGSTSSPFTLNTTVTSDWQESTMYVDYVRVYQGTDGNFSRALTTNHEVVTTTAAPSDGYTVCANESKVDLGAWHYYVGSSWAGAGAKYKGGESLNDFSLNVTASNSVAWGLQAFTDVMNVTPGHTYQYSITLNSNTAGASVLLKDELADYNLVEKTLVSGDNIFSGTYVPTSDTMQFMYDLGKLTTGTTVSVTNVTLTDVTAGETTAAPAETTTAPSSDINWTVVDNSNNVFYYGNADNMTVVNVQHPGWASADGIYMNTTEGIGYVSIDGNRVGEESAKIDGAGAVIYLTALTKPVSTVTYHRTDGSVLASVSIKNANAENEIVTTTVASSDIKPGEPGSSDIAAPSEVEAYNFYAQGKGYEVNFEEVEGATAYKVYMDNSSTPVATLSGSGEFIPASALSAYADDELHLLFVAAVDSSSNVSVRSEEAKVRVTKLTNSSADPTDVPRVYIVTNGGVKGGSSITKADKTPASLTIIGTDGVVKTANHGGTIKLRGNSTSLADKPAYNISFDSKKEILSGAAKGKKWCLMANAYDKSMMRSKLAMDFGNDLGDVATPDQEYVDVYIDGVYKGLFLISEPADNDRSGVSFDDSDESNEMMFEYEHDRVEDGQTYYTTGLGQRFVTTDPEELDTSTDRYSKWVSTLETFESALKRSASSDDVLNYIDVDSFVDMYIANEYFNTADFGYSSVKYYINNDANGNPIIYAGALWDFDLSSGNYAKSEARLYNKFRAQEVNLWFNYLMKNTTFKNKVIAKFKSMQARIQNIYKDNTLGTNQIDQIYDYIETARIRNYTSASQGGAGWSESEPDGGDVRYSYSYSVVDPYRSYTYDQHIEYLRDWLQNRNEWMCDQWGIDYNNIDTDVEPEPEPEPGTVIISDDIDITGYQMTASLNGVAGNMGFRVVYQAEPTVEGKTVTEKGLVYGLVYGDNPVTESDILYDSTNEYVRSYVATDAGNLSAIMGDSQTASYHVMTMNCGSDIQGISTSAYTTPYYVRAYAKLSDGTIVYSDVEKFTIFDVADDVYQNQRVNQKETYDYIYSNILHYVDSSYKEGDFDWGNTVVK